jgi:hypothetical protein
MAVLPNPTTTHPRSGIVVKNWAIRESRILWVINPMTFSYGLMLRMAKYTPNAIST